MCVCVCDVAIWTCNGVHGGSDLAGHHSSGEQLVQLDQLVGCRVKLECDAVQRVPRFHLDRKRRGKRGRNHSPAQQCPIKAAKRRPEDAAGLNHLLLYPALGKKDLFEKEGMRFDE